MENCPEIILIPLTSQEKPSNNVELLTIEEVLDKYGTCAYDAVNKFLKEQQENSPKHKMVIIGTNSDKSPNYLKNLFINEK